MKTFKRTLSIVLAVIMIFGCMSVVGFAADGEITVKLRVEGIGKCFYYGNVTVKEGASAYDVIQTADKADDNLTVSAYGEGKSAYIYAVNGETAGTHTTLGWDGWMFMVDGVAPNVSVGEFTVEDGASVVLYYTDQWNTGMQYPEVDVKSLGSGKIVLTSLDTVYDPVTYEPTVQETPVANCTLLWTANGKKVKITSDENGVCKIPNRYLTIGDHNVQVERCDANNGLPTVLRLEPDFKVNVDFFDGISAILRMVMDIFDAIQK